VTRVIVSGAAAYDQLCHCDGPIVRQPQLLNYKLKNITEQLGGCGANIAYGLARLGVPGALISCTGAADDRRFFEQWRQLNIDTNGCLRVPTARCARAIILTGTDHQQLTGFHPGPDIDDAAWTAHLNALDISLSQSTAFVQAPLPFQRMRAGLAWARDRRPRALRLWCPGQYVEQLCPAETAALADLSDLIVGNRYEVSRLREHHAIDSAAWIIETDGPRPVRVSSPNGDQLESAVPSEPAQRDPTGCGDALIAGLVASLSEHGPAALNHERLRHAVQHGIEAARACLTHRGAQNY
jgi:adenosine kinase